MTDEYHEDALLAARAMVDSPAASWEAIYQAHRVLSSSRDMADVAIAERARKRLMMFDPTPAQKLSVLDDPLELEGFAGQLHEQDMLKGDLLQAVALRRAELQRGK